MTNLMGRLWVVLLFCLLLAWAVLTGFMILSLPFTWIYCGRSPQFDWVMSRFDKYLDYLVDMVKSYAA